MIALADLPPEQARYLEKDLQAGGCLVSILVGRRYSAEAELGPETSGKIFADLSSIPCADAGARARRLVPAGELRHKLVLFGQGKTPLHKLPVNSGLQVAPQDNFAPPEIPAQTVLGVE